MQAHLQQEQLCSLGKICRENCSNITSQMVTQIELRTNVVTTAGSPSGMAATARATAIWKGKI